MSEADSPKTTFIFLLVVVGAFALIAAILLVGQFFGMAVREEVARKQLMPESGPLRQLRAEEQAKLTRYQWVDQKAGVVRIPIDRAMELVSSEWEARPAGFVPIPPSAPVPPAVPKAGAPPGPTPAN